MRTAQGSLGKPGMVIMSSQIMTINSAPALKRTAHMARICPCGGHAQRHRLENEYELYVGYKPTLNHAGFAIAGATNKGAQS